MSFEYRVSQGTILRHSAAPGLVDLEAWNTRDGKWIVYTGIGADWFYDSKPLPEEQVPEAASAAPSARPSA